MPVSANATQQPVNSTTQPAQSPDTPTAEQPCPPRLLGLNRQYSKMLDALNNFRS